MLSELRNRSEMNMLLRLELRGEECETYNSCIWRRNGVRYYSGYFNILLGGYLKEGISPSQMPKINYYGLQHE